MSQKNSKNKASDRPNFEEALDRLESIVGRLEEGETGLAEALAEYEAGVGLLKQCYELLEKAERRIEMLSGFDPQGKPLLEPVEDDQDTSLEEKSASRGRRGTAKKTSGGRTAQPPRNAEIDEPPSLF